MQARNARGQSTTGFEKFEFTDQLDLAYFKLLIFFFIFTDFKTLTLTQKYISLRILG